MEEPGRLTKSRTRLSLSLPTWQSPRLKGGAEAIKGRSQAVGTPLSQWWVRTPHVFPGPRQPPHLRAQRCNQLVLTQDLNRAASPGFTLGLTEVQMASEQASASQLVVAYNASPSDTGIFTAVFTLPH